MMKKYSLKSKSEMAALAREIAVSARVGDVFALKGTLGAGKSFFARHFINSLLECETEVLSPTFNLVYSYQTKKGEVSHFDLYRLRSQAELENIGFFAALENGISLIEWPEIAADFLPKNHYEIEIKIPVGENEEGREVVIHVFLS